MLNLLVILLIILLVIFAIIMAIDMYDARYSSSGQKKRVTVDEVKVRQEIDLSDIAELKRTASSAPASTRQNLQSLIEVCEAVYEGRGNASAINQEVARIAQAEGISGISTSAGAQYNCSKLIAQLRERM